MGSGNGYPDVSDMEKLFAAKDEFHKEMAKMPFEKKIKILVKLQEIAVNAKPSDEKNVGRRRVWEISE